MGPDKKEFSKLKPIRRLSIKRSMADRYPRNALCPCGSGKKYKRCCWSKGNEPGPSIGERVLNQCTGGSAVNSGIGGRVLRKAKNDKENK